MKKILPTPHDMSIEGHFEGFADYPLHSYEFFNYIHTSIPLKWNYYPLVGEGRFYYWRVLRK